MRATIKGYDVEVEPADEQQTSQCHINKGGYNASLAALLDLGVLYDSRDKEHKVPDDVIDEIEAFAIQHGY